MGTATLPPPTATATTMLLSLLSTLPMLPPPTTLMPSTTSTTLARGLLRLRLTLPTLSTPDTLPTPLTLPTLVLTTMVDTGPTTGSGNYSTLPNQKHARHDNNIGCSATDTFSMSCVHVLQHKI